MKQDRIYSRIGEKVSRDGFLFLHTSVVDRFSKYHRDGMSCLLTFDEQKGTEQVVRWVTRCEETANSPREILTGIVYRATQRPPQKTGGSFNAPPPPKLCGESVSAIRHLNLGYMVLAKNTSSSVVAHTIEGLPDLGFSRVIGSL